MPTIAQYGLGVVLFAHGWVHFVYAASSQGWFGPAEGWRWGGRSWLLSRFLDERVVLNAVTGFFLLVALGFVAGAVGYVLSTSWWIPLLAGAAVLSTVLWVVLWDGRAAKLFDQGGLSVLINAAVLAWLLVFA